MFLAPSNLFYKFWETGSYIHGLQIDYLIGKVYLSQIPLLLLLILWLSEKITWSKLKKYWQSSYTKYFIILFLILGFRQLFTPEPIVSLWQWFSLGTVGLFGLYVHERYKTLGKSVIPWALAATIVFQSIVGLVQYTVQHELIGYQFLGEPTLSRSIGITTATVAGAERILPYGTTAHPNVLAGFLAIYSLLLLRTSHSKLHTLPIILLGTITVFITTSVSGVLTLCFGLLLTMLPNKILPGSLSQKVLLVLLLVAVPILIASVATTAPKNLSVVRRAYLQQSGLRIFAQYPIFGTGIQTVTRYIESYSPSPEVVRFTQPPHHVGVSLLAETGIFGLGILVVLLHSYKHSAKLLAAAPILVLDHYIWTILPGTFLIFLFMAVVSNEQKNLAESEKLTT